MATEFINSFGKRMKEAHKSAVLGRNVGMPCHVASMVEASRYGRLVLERPKTQ